MTRRRIYIKKFTKRRLISVYRVYEEFRQKNVDDVVYRLWGF